MPVTPPPIYGLIDSRPDHISSTIFAVDAGRRLRMKKTLKAGPALLLIASLGVHVDVVAQQIARVEAPMPKPAAIRKPGTLAKASSTLAEVLEEYEAHAARGHQAKFKPSNEFLQGSSDFVVIDARATNDGQDLLENLQQLGLVNGSHYGHVVSGRLPYSAIREALELPGLRSISATPRPITHAGSITSQGDVALRSDIARSNFHVDGTGVTVGVISDAFDTLGGAAADVASGDLPADGVQVLNGESTLCGTVIFCIDEGRAMLQIVHDVAPGADLLFHSGIDGLAAYANAIVNLKNAGADIIIDDLLLINEPMFQDGIVAQAIDSVVDDGVMYFAAAGNSGRNAHVTSFDDSGEIFCIEFFEPIGDCDPIFERVGSMHDFDPGPGVDNYMSLTIPVNSVMTIAMQWDQPYGGAGPETDHDIVLLNGTGETYIAISANDNVAMGEGWEALQYDNSEFLDNGTDFSIIITYDDVDSIGPPATLLKLVVFGEDITINEYATNDGALYGHANAAGAETVGAAFFLDTPEFGTSPPLLQPYSSAGGTPIIFDTNGTRLTTPEVRNKPNITAVDGVNTTFFFDDRYGDDGVDDFFGTSAAAPHAAGVAALLLDARPGATPDQIKTALHNTAIDMGVAGFDSDSGYGLIQTDAAIAEMLALFPNELMGMVSLPDISGNGIPELGVVVPGNTRVHIRDAMTGDLLNDIDFGSDAAFDLAVLPDLNASGSPEIAILQQQLSGQVRVQIRDSQSGNSVSGLWYGLQYQPIRMTVIPDYSTNGSPEIAVLGQEFGTDAVRVQLRDSSTNAFVDNIFLGTQSVASDLVSVTDTSGNGIPEMGILGVLKDNGQVRSQIWDADTAVFQTNIWFGNVYQPHTTITMPDINSNGSDEIVAMGVDPATQNIRVQVRDSDTSATLYNVWLGAINEAVDIKLINDINSDGISDLAVLLRTPGDTGRVRVQSGSDGAFIRNLFYTVVENPVGLAVVPDYSGNGFDELAALGENIGVRHVQILDTSSGSQVNRIDFP